MIRKASICTLCAQTAQSASSYLKQKASIYSSSLTVNDFGDAAAFAAGVDACALEGGIVFAAAPLSLFLNAKLRIVKALSSKIVRSNSILNAMGYNAPNDQKERDLQAAIPEKAKVIPSADGLYSAFAKEYGNSVIIFLPLDGERLDYIFANGLSSLLEKLLPIPQSAPAVPVPPVAVTAEASPEKPKLSALREHVETVIYRQKSIAISPCGCAKALISAINSVPGSENAFVADGALRDRLTDESVENYVAQCAKISKENSNTDLGIAVSSIYKDKNDDSDFVVVCVADSDRAKAAKVYANPGEEKKYLVAAAVIRLCEMLGELSASPALVNPDIQPSEPKKWSKNSKLPIILTAVGIALAVVIAIVVAFLFGGDKQTDVDSGNMGVTANQNLYDFVQQEDNDYYYEDVYFHGGSAPPVDMQADAAEYGITTTVAETTTERTTVTQTVTKIITTIKNVVTTKTPTTIVKPTTTKKPTTTAKATTTQKITTIPATTLITTAVATASSSATASGNANSSTTAAKGDSTTTTAAASGGKFVFKVYGYGHGVGMSQDGAIQMAKNGSTYDKILTHYYTGTTVKTDSETPATVKYGGKDIPLVEYLCRTTKPEIGASAPTEALKAQIVTAYTYAKYYDFDVKTSLHAYSSGYEYEGTDIHKACLAVLGMTSDTDTPKAKYVDYNGKAAFTCYFATAATKTTSAANAWGGSDSKYPYLSGGVSSPEDPKATEVTITAEEMKKLILDYAKNKDKTVDLSGDPSTWIKILSHDSAKSENIGYVSNMNVGGVEVSGNTFRSYIVDFKLRSHCFTFEYIPG